jgi:hypothetical protein
VFTKSFPCIDEYCGFIRSTYVLWSYSLTFAGRTAGRCYANVSSAGREQ